MTARSGKNPVRHGRPSGFTLTEMLLVGGLMSLLVLLISGAWRGLGRSSADAAVRCRIAQEARLAAATLARDFSGSLPEQVTGGKKRGRLVGRTIVAGPKLMLCFDGEPVNGVANWAAPDTVVVYQLETETTYGVPWKRLVRENLNTGAALTAAGNVEAMALTNLGDSVKIDLTLTYRDLTRTYTIVANDP